MLGGRLMDVEDHRNREAPLDNDNTDDKGSSENAATMFNGTNEGVDSVSNLGGSNVSGNEEILVDNITTNCFKVSNPKGKGGEKKKFKKKHKCRTKSVSPQDQERPKKRLREDSDPFGLDPLIWNARTTPANDEGGNEDGVNSKVFLTPDLNKSMRQDSRLAIVVVEEVNDEAVHNSVQDNSEHIGDEEIIGEVVTTVELGNDLGVENVADFATEIQSLVRQEGCQLVNQ